MHVMRERRTNSWIDGLNDLGDLDVPGGLTTELSRIKQIQLALFAAHDQMIGTRQHRGTLSSKIEIKVVQSIEICRRKGIQRTK